MQPSALAFLLALVSNSAVAEPYTAKLYAIDSKREKQLFRLQRVEEKQGANLKATVRFFSPTDPKSTEALVTEEIFFENGNLKKYLIHSKLPPAEGSLEIRDGKVYFSYARAGEKPNTDDEDMAPNLVIGPTITDYIRQPEHFDKLKQDEDVKVRFASVERAETVGFTFSRSRIYEEGGKQLLEVKMKATSFIIAAIVDPLYFTYELETRKPVAIRGRTLPKQLVDGKWKDLDIDFVYDLGR